MADHRYEREIDELLRHMEAENRAPLPFRRRRAAPWTAAWRRARGAVSGQSAVEQLMALAAVLMVGTLLLALLAPRFAGPLGLAASAASWPRSRSRSGTGRRATPRAITAATATHRQPAPRSIGTAWPGASGAGCAVCAASRSSTAVNDFADPGLSPQRW